MIKSHFSLYIINKNRVKYIQILGFKLFINIFKVGLCVQIIENISRTTYLT